MKKVVIILIMDHKHEIRCCFKGRYKFWLTYYRKHCFNVFVCYINLINYNISALTFELSDGFLKMDFDEVEMNSSINSSDLLTDTDHQVRGVSTRKFALLLNDWSII